MIPGSAERGELYDFLTECFKDADVDRDGLVNEEEFDLLIEKAAALPRRFGLAPSWKTLYGNIAARIRSRAVLFREVAGLTPPRNAISIDNWIEYSFKHVGEKVRTMPMRSLDFENLQASGRNNFLRFLRVATRDKSSAEYQELYQFLFKTFLAADQEQEGAINFEQFDMLVDLSARAPRALGLAPTTDQMFNNADERRTARRELFDKMEPSEAGTISFGSYLKYTLEHITEKVTAVDAEESKWLSITVPKWRTTASAFGPWVRKAIQNPRGEERRELYAFLSDCFMDADTDRDGFVSTEEFDFLCETAVALPRRFGLAPTWRELYGTAEKRRAARRQLFDEVDCSKRGTIGMDDWMQWSMKHVQEKVDGMDTEIVDFADLPSVGKNRFLAFCKIATSAKKSRQHNELYQFLFSAFVQADKESKGTVTLEQFDYLIELSAAAPRALGLAPKSSDMFASDEERLKSRKQLFERMDRGGTGVVSFAEYLSYIMGHINDKSQGLKVGKCPMGFT